MDNFFGTAPIVGMIEHEIIAKFVFCMYRTVIGVVVWVGGWSHSWRMSTWSVINRRAHGFRIKLSYIDCNLKIKRKFPIIFEVL